MIKISKSFRKDLTGQIFDRLTVLSFIPNEKRASYWLCQCSCEEKTQKIIEGTKLGRTTKSCGCLRKESKDLINQTFGRLTVIEKSNKRGLTRNTFWMCQCSCGNKVEVIGSSLINSRTKSCGCLQRELNSHDLIGQTFGMLTVIDKTDKRTNGRSIIWKCQCSCEAKTIKEISGACLLSGDSQSCGCINYSIGEENIKKVLIKNNIKYIPQKTFEGLVSPINNKKQLPFDFAIYKNNNLKYIIEFDGPQHNKAIEYFGGAKRLERVQTNDKLKNEYCKNNNIPLIRIPYKERNNINLEMICLETTQYLFM